MSKVNWFILINAAIIIVAGFLCFKNFKNLRKSIFWLLFPNSISMWSRSTRDKDSDNTFRFEIFALIVFIIGGINFLVFKYVL